MNHTTIEWVKNPDGTQGYTLNSKTGCLNHTPEGLCLGGLFPCYAYKLANGRLRARYLANKTCAPVLEPPLHYIPSPQNQADPFYPRWWAERIKEPYQMKKPAGIFLDDMSDWMGDYWPESWTMAELQMMRDNPQHRIYTLTKQPQNLIKFSPFPDNCWVGVTACTDESCLGALLYLRDVLCSVRFLSIEPLLEATALTAEKLKACGIKWLIIGAMTGTLDNIKKACVYTSQELKPIPYGKRWTLQPKIEWVEEIVKAADKAGVKVFLKENLKLLILQHAEDKNSQWADRILDSGGRLRQEVPNP